MPDLPDTTQDAAQATKISLPRKRLAQQIEAELGVSVQTLLAPIDAQAPAGRSLRGSRLVQEIQEARREDDASLPMGPWQHELKQADWAVVCRAGVQALCEHSKDLQVAAWLLEARLRQAGLASLAPMLALLDALIASYWRDLFPALDGADASHRANVLRWINRKLVTTLKLVPLLQGVGERELSWADWEQVQHLATRRAAAASNAPGAGRPGPGGGDAHSAEPGAIDAKALAAALAALPTAQCLQTASALQQALAAMAGLVQTIDAHFEHDAPSLAAFTAVLQGMHDWIAAELRRRGVAMPLAVEDEADDGDEGEDSGVGAAAAAAAATAAAPSAEAAHAEPASTLAAKAAGAAPQGRALAQPQPQAQAQPQAQPVSARAQAYAQLASAAQTLREIDPHSPVPYLVQRAIAWGQLNTAQLYRELFVDGGGQISIFELLGVEVPQEAS